MFPDALLFYFNHVLLVLNVPEGFSNMTDPLLSINMLLLRDVIWVFLVEGGTGSTQGSYI